jgi:hypothetical protein
MTRQAPTPQMPRQAPTPQMPRQVSTPQMLRQVSTPPLQAVAPQQHRRGMRTRLWERIAGPSQEIRAFNDELLREDWIGHPDSSNYQNRVIAAKRIKKALQDNSQVLDLSFLRLETLPKCIGKLRMLKTLQVNNNSLKQLPDSICQLTRLQYLILDNNHMTSLPENIGDLSALWVLSVPHNRLLSLPESIGKLAALQELDVTNNELLVLPDSLVNLPSLSDLQMSGNYLQSQPHINRTNLKMYFGAQNPPPAIPNKLRCAVKDWSRDTEAGRAETRVNAWYGYGREPLAEDFADFVIGLKGTKDYEIGAQHFGLEVIDMLDQLAQYPELRSKCFMLVVDAWAGCGDRMALAFNAVKKECICHKGKIGEYSDLDLVEIGRGMLRLKIVDQIAKRKVASLGPDFGEPVEVFLGFQTMLAEELNLPGASRVMLYPRCSEITDADLAEARSEIAANGTRPQFIDFMANWEPWQEALIRMHPADFASMVNARHEQMNDLYDRGDTLRNDEYMREITRIETILPAWFKARTDEFLPAGPHSS